MCSMHPVRFSRFFFFSSRRRHTRSDRDWSSDVCSSDLELVDRRALPDELLEQVQRFRFRGSSGKGNLALSELPDFTCLPRVGAHHRGAISISPSLDYLERAYDDAKYGSLSKRPYMGIIF